MNQLRSGYALLLLSALIVTAQETFDETSTAKMRSEALEHSQIEHTVHVLSDRYGRVRDIKVRLRPRREPPNNPQSGR